MWNAPSTAKPAQGCVTFVTPSEVGEWKRGALRIQHEVEECPNCHRLQPNSAAVVCKFCGKIIAESTCHVCGFNLSPLGTPVPSVCDRCGAPSLHHVEKGYSAERLTGMYGGDRATFAFAFHPDAHETLSRLPLHQRSEMDRFYRTLQYGCVKDKCKLSTGATVIFFIARGRVVKATPEHLRQFDALIREAGIGYLMSRQETILAEKIAKEVRC
jgi:predicted amidophosphoribosyltransferase